MTKTHQEKLAIRKANTVKQNIARIASKDGLKAANDYATSVSKSQIDQNKAIAIRNKADAAAQSFLLKNPTVKSNIIAPETFIDNTIYKADDSGFYISTDGIDNEQDDDSSNDDNSNVWPDSNDEFRKASEDAQQNQDRQLTEGQSSDINQQANKDSNQSDSKQGINGFGTMGFDILGLNVDTASLAAQAQTALTNYLAPDPVATVVGPPTPSAAQLAANATQTKGSNQPLIIGACLAGIITLVIFMKSKKV
jgi:hypothetical protein